MDIHHPDTVTKVQILWTLYEYNLSWLWTLLLHVHVSRLHGHSRTLNIVFQVNTCYTEHCYFMYMYHCYTDTVTHNIIIFYSCPTNTRTHYFTEYCHFIYLYHRYMDTLYTTISHTLLLHRFTGVHALIVFVFLLHGSLFIYMHNCYMYIPVFFLHDWFLLLILMFLLLDMNTVDMWWRN